jgi:hypothetical protein
METNDALDVGEQIFFFCRALLIIATSFVA